MLHISIKTYKSFAFSTCVLFIRVIQSVNGANFYGANSHKYNASL